jgi:hypothetical protein
MNQTVFKVIVRWIETVIHLLVPLAAAVIAIYPELLTGQPPDSGTLLRLTLGVVAGMAIAGALERYVVLRDIETQTRKLSETVNLDLLRSAKDCGVVDVYPRADKERMAAIVAAIKSCKGPLDICGIALPKMITDDSFREAVLRHSERADVRVLLLKPDSPEAQRRAEIEAILGRTTIAHIVATADWIMKQQIENKRFRLHFYDLPPMMALVITDQFVFVEPYHFGRPEGVEGCIGGHVPMMKIRTLPELGPKDPYGFFQAHYEYLWNFTLGLRATLKIPLIEAKPSTYVVLENQTGHNIRMDGWELTGQGAHRPYQFERGFEWQAGERIVVTRNLRDHPGASRVLKADGDFMGNNTILKLTTGSDIWVAEWSVPATSRGGRSAARGSAGKDR